jgi:hypothetical protein
MIKFIRSWNIFAFLIVSILCFYPVNLRSQNKKGLGGDIGMSFNSNQQPLFHYSITYNWLIRKNLIVSTGGMLLYSKLDENWGSYALKENVIRLNSISSLTYTLPLYKQTGLYENTSFIFEPIPVDYISIDKYSDNGHNSKGKYIYSGFIPGVFLEAGVYHNFIKNNKMLKLFCGIGYGWYDPFIDYRNTTLDGQNLSTHIPNDKNYYRLSLKIIGL